MKKKSLVRLTPGVAFLNQKIISLKLNTNSRAVICKISNSDTYFHTILISIYLQLTKVYRHTVIWQSFFADQN